MKLRRLLEFAATLAEGGHAASEITPRCRWRDERGGVRQQVDAKMGYCSGLDPVLYIEMGNLPQIENASVGLDRIVQVSLKGDLLIVIHVSGPCTDEEIIKRYADWGGFEQSDLSVKTVGFTLLRMRF